MWKNDGNGFFLTRTEFKMV